MAGRYRRIRFCYSCYELVSPRGGANPVRLSDFVDRATIIAFFRIDTICLSVNYICAWDSPGEGTYAARKFSFQTVSIPDELTGSSNSSLILHSLYVWACILL